MLTPILAMAQPGDPGGGMVSTLVMFGLIIGIFYFMIIRPQQKKQKDRQKMLDAIKKGDKVVTIGGLHGVVVGVEEKTVVVQATDNVKLKFDKTAISVITTATESEAK